MNSEFREDVVKSIEKQIKNRGGVKKIWAELKADGVEAPKNPEDLNVMVGDPKTFVNIKNHFLYIWDIGNFGEITPRNIFEKFQDGDLVGSVTAMVLALTKIAVEKEHKRDMVRFIREIEDCFSENSESVIRLSIAPHEKKKIEKLVSFMFRNATDSCETYITNTLANFWILKEQFNKVPSEDIKFGVESSMRIGMTLEDGMSQVIAGISSLTSGRLTDELVSLVFLRALEIKDIKDFAEEIKKMNENVIESAKRTSEYKKFCEVSQIMHLLINHDEAPTKELTGKYQDLFLRARSVIGNDAAQKRLYFFGEPDREVLTSLISNQYLTMILVNAGAMPGSDFINLTQKWYMVADGFDLDGMLEDMKNQIEPKDNLLLDMLEALKVSNEEID